MALATGAKKSMAGLAAILPRLQQRYDSLLEALGDGQGQAAAARGIGYALEREILQRLPCGDSAQLVHVAKLAVNLKDLGCVDPGPLVVVLLVEFLSDGQVEGKMETALFGPLSRRDIAELAMEFFGRRKFVKLADSSCKSGTITTLLLTLWAAAARLSKYCESKTHHLPFGWHGAKAGSLRESALCVAAKGDLVSQHAGRFCARRITAKPASATRASHRPCCAR